MSSFSKGFVLDLKRYPTWSLIYHRPLPLRDVIDMLKEHLDGKFIVIHKGEFYGGQDHSNNLRQVFEKKGIFFKTLRQGSVALSFQEFQRMEKRLRREISGGDLEWFDCDFEPTAEIKTRLNIHNLRFSYEKEPVVPSGLGASVSYHSHDNEFTGMYVRNRRLEAAIIERLITRVAKKELKRLAKKMKPFYSPVLATMTQKTLSSLRSMIMKEGITCLRHDIQLKDDELIMTCWQGFPERAGIYNRSFDICYSFKKEEWHTTRAKSIRFPYSNAKLFP